MSSEVKVFLGLGSNLGDRVSLLEQAFHKLSALAFKELRRSSIYTSPALNNMPQPDYCNQVLCGITSLSPHNLLQTCFDVEHQLGRVRNQRWESRLIDIDILSYEQLILSDEILTIPHPELTQRSFVLLPLLELDSSWIHPQSKKNIQLLWSEYQQNHQEESIAQQLF